MMQSCIEEDVVVSSAICRQRQESDERNVPSREVCRQRNKKTSASYDNIDSGLSVFKIQLKCYVF
jgi:hypothetical protein